MSRTVFLSRFVDTNGCAGSDVVGTFLSDSPSDRATMDALRDRLPHLAAPLRARLEEGLDLSVPPEPAWDASFPGTRAEWSAARSAVLARSGLVSSLRATVSRDALRLASADVGLVEVRPLGWFPEHVGDEDEDTSVPLALAVVRERPCLCSCGGWWGDLEEDALTPDAQLHEVGGLTLLSRLPREGVPELVATAGAAVEEELVSYAVEREAHLSFVRLPDAEVNQLRFGEWEAYQAGLQAASASAPALSRPVPAERTHRLSRRLAPSGLHLVERVPPPPLDPYVPVLPERRRVRRSASAP